MLYLPKADPPGLKNFEHGNACFVHLVTLDHPRRSNRRVGGVMKATSLHIGPPRMTGRSVSEPHSSFASLPRHFTRIFTASN